MADYDLFIYNLNSVTQYDNGYFGSNSPSELFPSGLLSDGISGSVGTVTFGNLNGTKHVITDGDTQLNYGDSSQSSDLVGTIDTEYVYRLVHPTTSETIYIYSIHDSSIFSNPIGFASTGVIDPNVTYTIYEDTEFPNANYSNFIPCFVMGTRVALPGGETSLIEDLRVGDLVLTVDHGPQRIKWIGERSLDNTDLAHKPHLRPIRIEACALGNGLPHQDLMVSPQHRLLVRSKIAERMFGAAEVLVAAKQLLSNRGIRVVKDLASVTYFHMLFERHELILANGTPAESLYTGKEALKSLPPKSRHEILTLFPELAKTDCEITAARPLATGRRARQLATRHRNNRKELLAPIE
jgi:hypothetical protein